MQTTVAVPSANVAPAPPLPPSDGPSRSRPFSAGPIAFRGYSCDAVLGPPARPSSASRQHKGWNVASSVPRTFDHLAANELPESMPLKWGPKEAVYRQIGSQTVTKAREQLTELATQARDGHLRRQKAEEARKAVLQTGSGEPWFPARHGGRRTTPQHLPGGRYVGRVCGGLFGPVAPLEASESQARWSEALARGEIDARRTLGTQRRSGSSRPASAPSRGRLRGATQRPSEKVSHSQAEGPS